VPWLTLGSRKWEAGPPQFHAMLALLSAAYPFAIPGDLPPIIPLRLRPLSPFSLAPNITPGRRPRRVRSSLVLLPLFRLP